MRRTTKCVCNIVFRFVYRSVEHAVLEVSFCFSKVADNVCLDLWKNILLSKFANCKCTHGTKSATLNALENSFALFWDYLYILWKSSMYIAPRFLKIYVLKIGENKENIKATRKILRQQTNTYFSILNSSAPSQNVKSRTSCRRLFETFLPSRPTEITFEISFYLARS